MVLTQKQDQQNSVEKQTYGQLIYNKGGKNMQWSQDSLFHMSCWENWTALCKRLKLEQFLTPCTKINSKQVKDLNVKPDATKLFEENIGRTFFDINYSNIFLDPLPRVMEIITK